MIHENRIRLFLDCLSAYTHQYPLSRFLKEFFRANKQMGSRDRKFLQNLMYSYFRLGDALKEYAPTERLLVALFLCGNFDRDFMMHHKAEWEQGFELGLEERIAFIFKQYADFNLSDVFPLHAEISEQIDRDAFLKSHFIQPDLFLRAIENKHAALEKFLSEQNISYSKEGRTFRLNNATKLEESVEYLFEVQDKSSQQVINYLHPKVNEYWWDCCAASGGKSLLLKELEPNCYLICSDVRDTILLNLDERFKRAGIDKYKRRVIDLTAEINSFEPETFDGIILDAPCTGSGTWSRTPERIQEVDIDNLNYFSELQYAIADNAIQFLKKGKPMIYITCSVFAKENEVVVEKLAQTHNLKISNMEYIKGYQDRADTMFIATLIC